MHLIGCCLLVILTSLALTSSSSDQRPKRRALKLDCVRFVFAPQCRGVAAKRGLTVAQDIPEPEILDDAILDSFLSMVRNQKTLRPKQSSESYQTPSSQAWLKADRRPWPQNSQVDQQGEDDGTMLQ